MSFYMENLGLRWVCAEELEGLEDDIIFRVEDAFDRGQAIF
jgi:hypothetical protein